MFGNYSLSLRYVDEIIRNNLAVSSAEMPKRAMCLKRMAFSDNKKLPALAFFKILQIK